MKIGKFNYNDVVELDCLMLLSELPDKSVPLIITDAPYGIGYHSNYYKDKNPHSPVANDWNFQISPFLNECWRVLQDGGALYLFCRWDVMPVWIPSIPSGLKLKSVIVWVKNNWSAGDLTGCFGNQYEQILFITKGRHLLRDKRWPNVWEFPRVPSKKLLHPTQKPVDLLERAINASSNEGDIVLDTFAGSGSTGLACINTKRSYLLGDIDKNMVQVARKRLGLSVEAVKDNHYGGVPSLKLPDPSLWGIHPEELQFIWQELMENLK